MNVLAFLIPVALLMGLGGLIAFLWSLKSGQFDDLKGATYRALFEEDEMESTSDETSLSSIKDCVSSK